MGKHGAAATAMSERVQTNSRLGDQAYLILRQAIMSWHFKPGDRLLQKELALEIGVSQMVIREALSRLEAEGLVVTQPYKGTSAAPYSLQDIEDLYDIRLLLEGRAL
ncbi:MAG TPA: GntR family transcriptional regulator, partial [Anaerolineaceae bacterium]|nr:GntR family transcriptional regulator [Anaerolineaceae bacterium]